MTYLFAARLVALSFFALSLVLAIPPAKAEAAGELERVTLTVDGVKRYFLFAMPAQIRAGETRPLIIVLHGGKGNPKKIAHQTGFESYVDSRRFFLAYPDSGGDQWNDGRANTATAKDDVKFIRAVADYMANTYAVDTKQVYVAGVSNGGMMAQRLACQDGNRYAGFASVAANLPVGMEGKCVPSHALRIVFFQGTDDPLMPYEGGTVAESRLMDAGGGDVYSTAETIAFWTRFNNCRVESRDRYLPQQVEDGTKVKQDIYACPGPARLDAFTIEGGGHTWPGGGVTSGLSKRIAGTTTQNIDATRNIVAIFIAYFNQTQLADRFAR